MDLRVEAFGIGGNQTTVHKVSLCSYIKAALIKEVLTYQSVRTSDYVASVK